MELFLLKVKHKYDAEYEEIGIFSSLEQMRIAKKQFLKLMENIPAEEYTFTHLQMKLDELYY